MSVLHVVLPCAIVESTIGKDILSVSAALVMVPVADILVTVVIIHRPLSLLIVLIP